MSQRLFAFFLALAAAPALAFNPPTDSSGSLTATIEPVPEIDGIDKPVPVSIRIENRSGAGIRGEVEIRLADDFRIDGPARRAFEVAAGGATRIRYGIAAGPGTFPELYPIHAFVRFREKGEEIVLRPVLIIQPKVPWPAFPAAASAPREAAVPIGVAPNAEVWLAASGIARVRFQVFGRGEVVRPFGWEGSDGETGANFSAGGRIARGEQALPSLSAHPPWRGGAGTIRAEYVLRLPPAGPIRLRFQTAIRDHTGTEPPSDGVTFRAWVAESGQDPRRVFERHSAAKVWEPAEVDLSGNAGREIVLGLEFHPGPKNDTTCDQAFIGAPVIVAGDPGSAAQAEPERLLAFETDEGSMELAIRRGSRGLFDSILTFLSAGEPADAGLSFRGFEARVRLSDGRRVSLEACAGPAKWEMRDGGVRVTHSIPGTDVALVAEMSAAHGGVRIAWSSPARIERLALGRFASRAGRVFAGMGNVIVDPQAFTLGHDGHMLSTRHVGFEFDGGWAMLQATDPPPDALVVSPSDGIYTIETHPDATFFLAAGRRGAMPLVRRWREACGLRASGGVRALAGRFVFDLWGGRYAESGRAIERAARYGLTHSLVVWHNWQRWGYDYRLPDIVPPNPEYGTLDEFRRLAETCRAHGILFAPHDNYIDFYPDAEGFTYDKICFHEDGRPVRAWLNEGRGAQSFRFRPDAFEPFLRRNIEWIARDVRPTAYFIDVFSSIGLFDYYDRSGTFHSRTETQRRWGEAFGWIRERLGGAPQVSESGHDGLIGWLDGAQTNHLRVDAAMSSWSVWRIPCADAERIPWYDLAYHDRFVLHGAGYSNRYEGGLPAAEHGIESDDYVTTEVLTGHPAMVPRPFGASVVRKYWLTHDLLDAVALVPFAEVVFEGGDIHRQIVKYENGAIVFANRGADDWIADGHTLPPYGFRGRAGTGGAVEAAIERIDGAIVEWARGRAAFYANPRAVDSQGRAQVRPVAAAVRPLGGLSFEIEFAWEARRAPLDADYSAFVHFVSEASGSSEREGIAFQADHAMPEPATRWQPGVVRTRARFEVPASAAPGRYPIGVGLWLPPSGRRLPILGPSLGRGRVQAGTLVLTRGGDGALAASIEPPPAESPPRWNVDGKPIDFGWVRTDGAFRIVAPKPEHEKDGLARILPLPDSPAFTIDLRVDRIPWLGRAPREAEAFDIDGKSLGALFIEKEAGTVKLRMPAGVFEVRLR